MDGLKSAFKTTLNYGEEKNIIVSFLSLSFLFLQIGREKGEFQLLLDALDKIKTKVKSIIFPLRT